MLLTEAHLGNVDELEGMMLREISQTEKEKNAWSFLYVKSDKQTNKLVDTENSVVARGWGGEAGQSGWKRSKGKKKN